MDDVFPGELPENSGDEHGGVKGSGLAFDAKFPSRRRRAVCAHRSCRCWKSSGSTRGLTDHSQPRDPLAIA
jgi:hypothetical protein